MATHVDAATYDGVAGGDRIQAAIEDGPEDRHRTVFVGADGPDEAGRWVLPSALELPSHTTLVLAGATLYLADGADDNLIRNAHFDRGDRDIHLVGLGVAQLHGNPTEQDRSAGPFHTSFGVHFYDVANLSMRGLTIGPTESWGLTPEKVRNVRLSDLSFAQDASRPNQDGIHVTGPAEQIAITNVTGTFGDDAIVARSGRGRYGEGGDLRGMTVSNVAVRNVSSCGVLRTVVSPGAVLDGLHATNLYMASDEEKGDAAIKIGYHGTDHVGTGAGEHRNLLLDQVTIDRWDGPVCVIQQPVQNLVLRGVTARHTGPFLYNEEHDVDGLTLEDCESVLTGSPPDTLINQWQRELLAGEKWLAPDRFEAAVLTDPPGAVTFDRATIRDVRIRNCRFRAETEGSEHPHPAALRVYDSVDVDGLSLADVTVEGYETGVRVDDGADVRGFSARTVRQRDVRTPWDVASTPTGWANDPPAGE